MNRLALFDCDGTLVDSHANICRAMIETFVDHRLDPPDHAAIRRIVGLSLVEAVAALHPDGDTALHHGLADTYRRTFQAMRADSRLDPEPLFPGIADAIAALDDAGWLFGVATGKSDRGLALVLGHHDLLHRFVTLQTADRHPSKPHPGMVLKAMSDAGAAPTSTIVIGDTSFDMAMGVAAGATAIGAGWGYHEAQELLDAGARGVAMNPADVVRFAKEAVHG